MRIVALILFLLTPLGAQAQVQDSVFENPQTYENFVNSTVYKRDFKELIRVLGGRDEYTEEQLAGLSERFLNIYPMDFTNHAVINVQDMGGGFRQEMRVFWTKDQLNYLYYYALLHRRSDQLVVIKFNMNSNADPILDQF